ncbi:MAG: DUF5683 domain-containing protein [Bacteroidia bacterium]
MKVHCSGLLSIAILALFQLNLAAQTDSIPAPVKKTAGMSVMKENKPAPIEKKVMDKDSSSIAKVSEHSPKRAALYSAMLPGLGQVYNKKYWKVPIIAVGAGALVYSFNFNQNNFSRFKLELIKRQQNLGNLDPDLDRYTDANLNELQDFYRRNRDLSIVGMALLYALNIIDATVDAHLFDFNVSDDLSLKIRPSAVYTAFSPIPAAGIGLNFRF